MNIQYTSLFFLLFCPILFISAQYTDELNSNRPGASQGAFSVGKKVLQFETGLSLGKEEHDLKKNETNAFVVDYSVRYGIWKEELEVSIMGEYQSNTITDFKGSLPYEYKESNFTSNTIGVKYLFFDPYRKMELEGPNVYSWKANYAFQWRDLIPAISIYAGANFDAADNPLTPDPVEDTPLENESSISPKFVLSTQNNWMGGFVFVTNIIVDRITTDSPTYSYILTLTHTPTDWFSIFVENQGIKSDFYADQLFRGGAAVLINENFQVDGSVLLNFKDTPSRLFGRIGVSYRFDMHDSDEYIEDKGRSGRKNKRDKNKTGKKDKRKDGFDNDRSMVNSGS